MRLIPTLAVLVAALVIVTNAGAVTTPQTVNELSLSSSSALAPQTVYTTDGSMTSTVALDDAATNTVVAGDGYPCGDVQYRATQRWYDPFGIVVWTYRSTFGVHVCHNKVQYKTALYDEAMDSNFGWSWCGNIVKTWAMNPNNASAHSYTKGCFEVLNKVVDARYPWAKMTIGGNGGLWVRNTGVD